MKLKIVVHKAEEGGFWAEVPAIKGCFSQGETMEELLENIKEGNTIKIITAYPCREIQKEIDKKEGKRWIKVR